MLDLFQYGFPLDFDRNCILGETLENHTSDTCCTIMDSSWPKGQGVNDGVNKDIYLGTQFEVYYPIEDKIVRQLNAIGPAAHIFKVGISRAFRHI